MRVNKKATLTQEHSRLQDDGQGLENDFHFERDCSGSNAAQLQLCLLDKACAHKIRTRATASFIERFGSSWWTVLVFAIRACYARQTLIRRGMGSSMLKWNRTSSSSWICTMRSHWCKTCLPGAWAANQVMCQPFSRAWYHDGTRRFFAQQTR